MWVLLTCILAWWWFRRSPQFDEFVKIIVRVQVSRRGEVVESIYNSSSNLTQSTDEDSDSDYDTDTDTDTDTDSNTDSDTDTDTDDDDTRKYRKWKKLPFAPGYSASDMRRTVAESVSINRRVIATSASGFLRNSNGLFQ
ncbi:hypothetical protein TWF730_010699 [Orbilia blumenaviensis]|uniref:Uncharacterized protein n=1 Tax=Orbilia blumenaviensis TaxID=1796055 RepID=A0AAV9UP08_9PEZI